MNPLGLIAVPRGRRQTPRMGRRREPGAEPAFTASLSVEAWTIAQPIRGAQVQSRLFEGRPPRQYAHRAPRSRRTLRALPPFRDGVVAGVARAPRFAPDSVATFTPPASIEPGERSGLSRTARRPARCPRICGCTVENEAKGETEHRLAPRASALDTVAVSNQHPHSPNETTHRSRRKRGGEGACRASEHP